jgi:DNA/RNA endonuclease YhcR with UshA esterase domain
LPLLLISASVSFAAQIGPENAAIYIGQSATVCGVVASAKYAAHSRAQPAFLDMGQPYPNDPFTALIFGSDRAKFGEPETTLAGKPICVIGQVRSYRGKPEIILTAPSQLLE